MKFNEQKGYCFIKQDGSQQELFVHKSSLAKEDRNVGARIEYTVEFDERKGKEKACKCRSEKEAILAQGREAKEGAKGQASKKDEVPAADAAKEKQPEVKEKEGKEKAKRNRAMWEPVDVRA